MLAGCRVRDSFMQTMILEPGQFAEYLEEKSDCMRYCRMAEEVYNDGPRNGSVDYAQGFKDGFVDFVMAGGTVTPPLLPPRRYWRYDYQTPEGQRAAHDWFAGFEAGAVSARDGGYRDLVTIPSTVSAYMGSAPHAPPVVDRLLPDEIEEVVPEEPPTPSPETVPLESEELPLPEPDVPLDTVTQTSFEPVVVQAVEGVEPSNPLRLRLNSALPETDDSVGPEVDTTHDPVNEAKPEQPAQEKPRDNQMSYFREALSI